MVGDSSVMLSVLEEWSATAFLAAGGLWVANTLRYVLEYSSDISVPDVVPGVLMLTAFLLTLAGVIGLYPRLADETPKLALAGILQVTVAAIAILVTLAWLVGAGVSGIAEPPSEMLSTILILNLLALLLFGVASTRTGVPTRTGGILVLVLATTWGVWAAGIAGLLGGSPEWASPVLGTVFSVVTLAVGYVHHTNSVALDTGTPSDVTPGE